MVWRSKAGHCHHLRSGDGLRFHDSVALASWCIYKRGRGNTLRLEALGTHGLVVTISIMIRIHRKGIRVFNNCTNLLWGCCSQRPYYLPLFCDLWPSSIEGSMPSGGGGCHIFKPWHSLYVRLLALLQKDNKTFEIMYLIEDIFLLPCLLAHVHADTSLTVWLSPISFSWSRTSALF